MSRALVLLFVCLAATPAAAQDTTQPVERPVMRAPVLDPRLLVTANPSAGQVETAADAVTRSPWRYPAIGAAVGAGAGVAHAYAITRGDYIGWPVDPMYLLPFAYGAVGAFVGLLADRSERERKARR